MGRKKMLIYVLIISIVIIGFGCTIMFNGYLKKSRSPTSSPIIEKENKDILEESHNQIEYADIQLKYLPYPEMKEMDILIVNYPVNAAYCRVSVNLGNTSTSKIYLDKEKQITYYVPDNFNNIMYDVILFEFYDEFSQFIKNFKIAIEYDKNKKQFQIIDMKKCSDIASESIKACYG